jgi:lysophospholipase L1-like esterase
VTEKPSNRFEAYARYIPAVILIGFLVAGIGMMVQPAFVAKAYWFSPIWFYGAFFILVALVGLFAWRSGWGWLALGAVYLLIADIALGSISKELNRVGIGENLMPRRSHSILAPYQFDYHPLLTSTPRANYKDYLVTHTAFGTRMVGDAMTIRKDKPKLVVIGGSTTYDISASQGATWPEALQKAIPEMQVINYGVGGFASAEHVIQTAFYLPKFEPACVLYYLGWNDIRNTYVPNLDAGYADFHFRNKLERLMYYRDSSFTSIMRLMSLAARRLVGPDLNLPEGINELPLRAGITPEFDAVFRNNIRTMITLNKARGVPQAYIGQLFNNKILEATPAKIRVPYMPGLLVPGYPKTMAETNAALADEATKAGVPVIVPDQTWLPDNGFADFGHFNDKGSAEFAKRITSFVRSSCGLK